MSTVCTLCNGTGTVAVDPALVPDPALRVRNGRCCCDGCDGTGRVIESWEHLADAVEACDPEQWRMFTAAIGVAVVCLRIHDGTGRAAWVLAGMLDGSPPMRETHRAAAASGVRKARKVA